MIDTAVKSRNTPSKLPKRILTVLGVIVGLLFILVVGFLIYSSSYLRADATAIHVTADYNVAPDGANYVSFGDPDADTAYIFYPGGKVEYTAYSPIINAISQQGYLCIIAKMPLNFAFFDIDAEQKIRQAYPNVNHWYLGGHSLGGAMAAIHFADDPQPFEGLILMGSYSTSDLSDKDVRVMTIYGSEDMGIEGIEDNAANLPLNTDTVYIEGANHGQFGNYGLQPGDGTATIPWQKQQSIASEAISGFMS